MAEAQEAQQWPLTLVSLALVTRDGEEESPYEFNSGLNIVRGSPQAGKTTLLRLVDWVLGNAHPPIDHFGNELLEEYVSATLLLRIGSDTHTLTRSMDREVAGPTTKVVVDGVEKSLNALDDWLLDRLDWPRLKIPKGKVQSAATEQIRLTFRSILRHLYRREDSWQDFAYKEDEFQRRASLSYLLGFAEQRYASALFQEGVARRALTMAESRLREAEERAHFILNSLTKNLGLDQTELSGLEQLRRTVEQRLDAAMGRRTRANTALLSPSIQRDDEPEVEELRKGLETAKRKTLGLRETLANFSSARDLLNAELERLTRSVDAVSRFGATEVLRCPSCHSSVQRLRELASDEDHCFLCRQELQVGSRAARIEAEIGSLRGELLDVEDVTRLTQADLTAAEAALADVDEALDRTLARVNEERKVRMEPLLRDLDSAASEVARLQQQSAALLVAVQALEQCDLRSRELVVAREAFSESEKGAQAARIDRKEADRRCREFATCMTIFLNGLTVDPWTYGDITLLSDELDFYVGDSPWRTRLGGEAKVLFMFAYSYAIAALPQILPNASRFPGFMILDNPIQQGLPDEVVGEVLARFSSLADRLQEQVIACIVRDVGQRIPADARPELASATVIEIPHRP